MYNIQEQEELEHRHSTIAELSRADAYANGAHRPDQKWCLSDWDAWYLNPHWDGKHDQPHPDEECDEGDYPAADYDDIPF